MSIGVTREAFSRRYLALMRERLPALVPERPIEPALDRFERTSSSPEAAVARAAALAVAASAGGLAVALAAQVTKDLLDGPAYQQLAARADEMYRDQFPSFHSQETEHVAKLWSRVSDRPLAFVESGERSPITILETVYCSPRSLTLFEDEAELVFALAHEAAHVEARDSLGALGIELLSECLEHAEPDLGPDVWNLARALRDPLQDSLYQEEYQADRRGLETLVSLGYDPQSALRFLERQFASPTHPDGPDRARALSCSLPEVPQRARPKPSP